MIDIDDFSTVADDSESAGDHQVSNSSSTIASSSCSFQHDQSTEREYFEGIELEDDEPKALDIIRKAKRLTVNIDKPKGANLKSTPWVSTAVSLTLFYPALNHAVVCR